MCASRTEYSNAAVSFRKRVLVPAIALACASGAVLAQNVDAANPPATPASSVAPAPNADATKEEADKVANAKAAATKEEAETTVRKKAAAEAAAAASAPLPAPGAAPGLASTVAAEAPDAKALTPSKAGSPPDYGIICQYVLTSHYFKWLNEETARDLHPDPKKPGLDPKRQRYPTDCNANVLATEDDAHEDARVLNGPGDLMVVVPFSGYEDALKLSTPKTQLRLFLNGFDLGADGSIASAQRVGDRVALRFAVPNKKDSQPFWTTVFAEHGIIEKVDLDASVGWAGNPAFIRRPLADGRNDNLKVQVASSFSLVWAGSLAALLIWFFFWALIGSDTFRIAPTYPWWNDARTLQTKLHRATVPIWMWPFQRRKTVTVTPTDDAILEILQGYFSKFDATTLTPDKDPYKDAAKLAINGTPPTTVDSTRQTVIGLALTSDWGKFRLPFSLAKVQWGGWMMFATTAAMFLWAAYARFPVLEGSVLGLVAISTLTAGASLIIDNTSTTPNTNYSQGFFHDIMTDPNGVQQAHRYQAIVVNIMLFVVGLLYVWQHLAYPTFDQSWLELLGISGLAQVAGKGTLETKKGDQKGPVIVTQPSPATTVAPQTATFTVVATGNPSPSYQWQKSTDSGATYSDISSATNASYTTPATATTDSGTQYRVHVANASGGIDSATAGLTVG